MNITDTLNTFIGAGTTSAIIGYLVNNVDALIAAILWTFPFTILFPIKIATKSLLGFDFSFLISFAFGSRLFTIVDTLASVRLIKATSVAEKKAERISKIIRIIKFVNIICFII